MILGRVLLFLLTFVSVLSFAEDQMYPEMVGVWQGNVRTVQAGTEEVARGGMIVNEVKLKVTIEHQDGESFIGKSRSSAQSFDDPSAIVWGTIRSNGKEAIFVTSNGARGQLWFMEPTKFEYCLTNKNDELATAYCAELSKTQ